MAQNATMEEFEVIAVEAGQAIIDVGYKMEGRVDLKEFANPGEAPEVEVGDEVEVFLRSVENARGEAVISRDLARREAAWDRLEEAYGKEERVEGAIFGRVKGGFTVDLGGINAFLPGSQVDIRPVRDIGPAHGHGTALPDPEDGQAAAATSSCPAAPFSRKAAPSNAPSWFRSWPKAKSVEGVVKNITDYGAFVDLGGIDGLLHVTDMSLAPGLAPEPRSCQCRRHDPGQGHQASTPKLSASAWA